MFVIIILNNLYVFHLFFQNKKQNIIYLFKIYIIIYYNKNIY